MKKEKSKVSEDLEQVSTLHFPLSFNSIFSCCYLFYVSKHKNINQFAQHIPYLLHGTNDFI